MAEQLPPPDPADLPDPAAHGRSMNEIMQGATAAEAEMSADDRRLHGLADLAGAVETAMTIIGFFVVAAGLVLVLVGTITVEGDFGDLDVTYDVRSPGIMLIGFGVLFAPLAVLFARLAKVWALHNATE